MSLIRDAGTAAGEGSKKVEEKINLQKENHYLLCLFLLSNDVHLENNTRNHRKPLGSF